LIRLRPAEDRFGAGLALAVAFGANVGGIATPIGTAPNAIAFGALHAAGYHITFLRWVLIVAPLAAGILGMVGLLLFAFFKPVSYSSHEQESAAAISANGKATLIVLVTTVLLWLTSAQHGLTPGAVALLAAAALAAIGVLDQRDVMAIDWSTLILMWGGLSLGVAMERSGLTGYVQRADLNALPGGTWTVAIVLVIAAAGLSTFMSNTATAALLVPASLALSVPGKEQFAILAALACSFAMALPVSTPPNAVAYSTGAVSLQQMLRTGALISAIATALLLLGYKLMLPLLF
jgi:sodium-dependent dicarboxylate transporter 2/3/5